MNNQQAWVADAREREDYQKETLLTIIESVLPASTAMWSVVASRYQQATNEPLLRDAADIKRYFMAKLCDGHKKPTGSSAPALLIARAQACYERILRKEHAAVYGSDSDEAVNRARNLEN